MLVYQRVCSTVVLGASQLSTFCIPLLEIFHLFHVCVAQPHIRSLGDLKLPMDRLGTGDVSPLLLTSQRGWEATSHYLPVLQALEPTAMH